MLDQHLRSQFLLWLGAAISIAEIVTGTLLAPLGWWRALAAILLGHLIGGGLFLVPAGYLGAKLQQSAMGTVQLAFGQHGERLVAGLNALQLVGWTAVMIVNAQLAMNGVSQRLIQFKSPILMTLIVGGLVIGWLLMDTQVLFKLNNLVVSLLVVGAGLMLVTVFRVPEKANSVAMTSLTFGQAVELNVTMTLSWLPLIGDYTQRIKRPVAVAIVSAGGYIVGSIAMFVTGLLIVLRTGQTDIAQLLTQSGLGVVALLIIVFSTVTTTFMDVFSAATSLTVLTGKTRLKPLAIGVTVLGMMIALAVSLRYYENFLYLIGSIFAPLYAIIFVTYFIRHARLPYWLNFSWWLLGVIGYYYLQQVALPWGSTLTILGLLGLGVWLSGLIVPLRPLALVASKDHH